MIPTSLNRLFPFLLVTMLCVGGVELFYFSLERSLVDRPRSTEVRSPDVASPVVPTKKQERTGRQIEYSIIAQRNLFGSSTDLHPAEEQPVAEEELEETTLELVLMGTISTSGDDGRAIILNKKDRSQDIYRAGEQVEGALIKEIRRGKVILNVDGRNELLDISEARQYAQSMPRMLPPRIQRTQRRPIVTRPQDTNEVRSEARVVRPLRRIVRPRAAIAADRAARDAEEETALQEPDEPVQIEGEEELLEPETGQFDEEPLEEQDILSEEGGY